MPRARTRGADTLRCPACGTRLLTQWVGHTAALHARVALPPPDEPHPLATAREEITGNPNRLVWCLPRNPYAPPRLRWTGARHPPDCPHQHLPDHNCPPAEPSTLF
ncbi:hypothetical protein GA0115251_106940 [Streptomyces sp. TverLS-915]|uniref:hypothetical protein n=1 Tax=Streptomyces sp. TverLS-915 TaxID=1839763 RepID=UPI00081E1F67|nr:hypothetical protein [Streptomyces sp. TverLS-915]SCD41163.1 hypothetical protein GA0115251_106940 [Streptomyces sp. TverLS-915]